ncbi:DNA primase family protein [Flavobacterium sp. UBA7682]|uniref:DNA primase family protein n=1 Tax=Flavobacterium sp. UBA7682 TaxID=1946560 RepID=UPI0025C2FC42|nr:phage/plasmid primase, P4 family [Flavobacterium sp. UBA7682]
MESIDLNKVFEELTEINKNVKNNNLNEVYRPRIIKSVFGVEPLNKILEAIPKIFNYTEEEKYALKKIIKGGENVLIVEKLLEVSDRLDLSIGCENNFIFIYNKRYWEKINEKLFKHFLAQVAIKCGIEELYAKNVLNNESLFFQFIFAASLHKNESAGSTIKINLEDGTFHVRGNNLGEVSELKPHNKEDYFKYQLPFSYNPEATAPIFMKYLHRVLPDIDSQKILFEYLGYIFTKNMKLEKILILYGPGSNGKSVFFEIVTALLGTENVTTFSMENLCNDNGYYRIKIDSKLLNYASESDGKFNLQIFKKLVSGEPVEARSPYKEPVTITDYCKFIFNANTLPSAEHTDAFFRRPLILTFNQKISEEEKDINLSKKIIENELSGVFNLILEGLDRLIIQKGFSKSKVVEENHNNYRKKSNSVSLFLEDENWIKSTTTKIRLKDLYSSYRLYCSETGQRAFTQNNFSERLKEMEVEFKYKGTNNYTYVWIEKKDNMLEIVPFPGMVDDILKN